jgi:branched-chain amino acid transport system substrate-binding protein
MSRRKLVALAATAALVIAACGGDDDEESTSTEAPEATEAPAATDAPEATDAPAATDAPEATDAPAATDAPTDTEAPSGGGEAFVADLDACEDPDAASAVIEGDIKIGTSIPLSGGPAVLFAPFGDGFQAYFDFYNETNGGVNGQTLVPVVKDDQFTADLTKTNVDELVFDEEVALLSGIIGTGNNLVVQPDLNAQCIPQLWASTGASNWGDVENFPWTTGLLVPYPIEVEAFLSLAEGELGGGTVGLIYVNNEFGQAYAEALDEKAEEYGFEIVAEETIDAADSGAPAGQMSNLVAADPDIIIAVPLGAQCIAFMTELGNAKAANADFTPLVYQTATCANPVFFGAVANGGNEGVYTSSNLKDVNNPDNASDPDVVAYLEAFAASGSAADPGGIAVAGWLAAELTAHVLEQAAATGSLTRASVIEAARNIDYVPSLLRDGLTAQMDATDGYIAEGTQIQQWSGGGFVDVGEVINLEDSLGVYSG